MVKQFIFRNEDHSWISLQCQFLSEILCYQVLYVIIHEKSGSNTILTISFLAAEQGLNLSIFPHILAISPYWNQKL